MDIVTGRLNDSPIINRGEEKLRLAPYVDAMVEFIKECETPLTIGVQGDWGIGKTSFMNLVRGELDDGCRMLDAKYPIIYFNTWQYSQFSQEGLLSLSILKGIVRAIQRESASTRTELIEKSKKFGDFVARLGSQVLKAQTGVDVAAAAGGQGGDSPEDLTEMLRELKDEFGALVREIIRDKVGGRIVIMIDDLDRIRPIKALEFLESIKNFLDVEGCIFVIAVDYGVIKQGMVEKLGADATKLQGKSYFDKIIQVPFNMPISAYEVDHYIMALLGWAYDATAGVYGRNEHAGRYLDKIKTRNVTKEDADFFAQVTRLTFGNNPRSHKRVVNYANLLKKILISNRRTDKDRDRGTGKAVWDLTEAKILYCMASLHLAWPEIFSYLMAEPAHTTVHRFQDFEFIESCASLRPLLLRAHDEDELKSNIVGLFDELVSLLDGVDGDGMIDAAEWSSVRRVLRDANMVSARVAEEDNEWSHFGRVITDAIGSASSAKSALARKALWAMESHKDWGQNRLVRLKPAGKRFVNLLVGRRHAGSFVVTKRDGFVVYLKGAHSALVSSHPEFIPFSADCAEQGHYGVGDIMIKIEDLCGEPNTGDLLSVLYSMSQSGQLKG